jgi:hypothetical protein
MVEFYDPECNRPIQIVTSSNRGKEADSLLKMCANEPSICTFNAMLPPMVVKVLEGLPLFNSEYFENQHINQKKKKKKKIGRM